jgi:formate dehydrogenase iron-sulfur subunit
MSGAPRNPGSATAPGSGYGILFDATRCIGCGGCSAACKEQNDLPLPIEEITTAATWTIVEKKNGTNVRRMCMHCLEPTCASVCPVGAMHKTAAGPVVYDADKCIGCRYCIMACPFGVPKYEWDKPVPVVGKCVMCFSRIEAGQQPACATVCPTGATSFGRRDALIAEARARIAADPERYVDHVYGLDEAGGTSVLMLAGVPFGSLGLPTDLPKEALPLLTWRVLQNVPDFVGVAAVFLWGVHWITKRRDYVRLVEGGGSHAGREGGRP